MQMVYETDGVLFEFKGLLVLNYKLGLIPFCGEVKCRYNIVSETECIFILFLLKIYLNIYTCIDNNRNLWSFVG